VGHPFVILALGIGIVVGAILILRINAFVALITAALAVSLCAPGALDQKITRVAVEFGATAGKIGIVIAFAAVIGDCLTRSGAADRIVRFLMRLLGERRAPAALMASGFVLSIPVFFDTIFYLLLPLARSTHRRTGIRYLLLILAMGAGASITHSMVPPTPGPLILADIFKIDLGIMIMFGLAASLPTAVVIYCFVVWWSRKFDIPMRPLASALPEPEPLPDAQLPGLFAASLPITLPVLLISLNTFASSLAKLPEGGKDFARLAEITAIVGNPNLAMLCSAVIAAAVLARRRKPGRAAMARLVESSLSSAGLIILITSAGGAFGAMLKEARIGDSVEQMFSASGGALGGMKLLLAAFLVAFVIKFAQGSSTVAMLTAGAMMAALIGAPETLGFHPVYVALGIGWGAQCGNWMNDSGFWVFAKMGGLTEVEALKTWTVTVSLTAVVGLAVTMTLAALLPFA